MGMHKILPDTAFIAQWRDKIEAVVITHGHEDHIGAIPWVLPALDPTTPIYTSSFVHYLLKNRLQQYNLWDENRFHTFYMNTPFNLGPFECEALRVTHSIPDCCGLILRNEHGTILHTGDWKIDETPIDGRNFDRAAFEKLKKENVTLMMSDSTNILTPGRSISESLVRQALIDKVASYNGHGRVIATLFASNLHRVGSMKLAADASGRKLCFVGMSLESYLAAAVNSGDAPFSPADLIHSSELNDIDPNRVLIVTTGSQAEPQAALSMAAVDASSKLRLAPDDLVIYSARTIPGNEKRVMKMMNQIARIGHGYKEELAEVIKLVQPQHFLPVHGESTFLQAHAELANELGIKRTSVIHDGQMLGVKSLRSRRTVSTGSMQLLGDVALTQYFNDGKLATGTASEMAIQQRIHIGINGIIVVAVDVMRPPQVIKLIREKDPKDIQETLTARIKLTVRALWTNKGKLVSDVFKIAQTTISTCRVDASCVGIERAVTAAILRACRKQYKINPEIIVVIHENDPFVARSLSELVNNRGDGPENDAVKIKNGTRVEETTGNSAVQTEKKKRSGRPRKVPKIDSVPETPSSLLTDDSIEELLSLLPNGFDREDAINTEDKPEGRRKVKQQKSTERKTTTGKRRGRPPKKKPVEEKNATPGELIPVPEEILKARRDQNPRETPIPGADLEYG